MPKVPITQAATELENLFQPWNPLVRAAIMLMRDPKCASMCSAWVADFPYAEAVHKNGRWTFGELDQTARKEAIGFVLSGRLEAVIDETDPDTPHTSYTAVRPRPRSVLRAGAAGNLYEFTGRSYQRPETHPYTLYAGPVCVQFRHEKLCPFIANLTTGSLFDASGVSKARAALLHQWNKTCANFNLIQAFGGDRTKDSHAKVLFLHVSPHARGENFEHYTDAIRELAWRQSRRRRHEDFPSAVETSELFGTTIERIRAIKEGEQFVWTPCTSDLTAPAIHAFVQNFNEVKPQGYGPIQLDDIFLSDHLASCINHGYVSVIDKAHQYRVGEVIPKSSGLLERKLAGWDRDPFSSNAKDAKPTFSDARKRLEDAIKKAEINSEAALEKLPNAHVQVLPSADSLVPSRTPFHRLMVQIPSPYALRQVFSELDLVLKGSSDGLDLSGVLLVGCQHLLRETVLWMRHLIARGARVILAGKDYSTCPDVVRQLQRAGALIVEQPLMHWDPGHYSQHLMRKLRDCWARAEQQIEPWQIRKLLLVDDGGHLFATMPSWALKYQPAGIEQTTSGVEGARKASKKIPIVNVAQSERKARLESGYIAEAVIDRVREWHPEIESDESVGILGFGNIGKAMGRALIALNDRKNVFYFDPDSAKKHNSADPAYKTRCHSLGSSSDVIQKAAVIFGCSGVDSITMKELSKVNSKLFCSCGSSDNEFSTLIDSSLDRLQRKLNPFSTLLLKGGNQILNGGFPVNFDRDLDSVPLRKALMTRALMHVALVQAMSLTASEPGFHELDMTHWHEQMEPQVTVDRTYTVIAE